MGPFFSALLGTALASGASNQAKPEQLDVSKIQETMQPTQDLVNEQLGLSRMLRDPNSAINKQLQSFLINRGYNDATLAQNQIGKLGSMTGMSPGQIMMQNRIATNDALGGVNNRWMEMMQSRFGSGTGLLGSTIQMQQGLDENLANAYVQNINSMNQFRTDRANSAISGGLGGLAMGLQYG